MATTPNFGLPLYEGTDTAKLSTLLNGQSTAIDTNLQSAFNDIMRDTGWLNLLITGSGWSTPSGAQTPQARQIGKVVYFRGILVNSSFSGNFTTIARVPSSIPGPNSENGATAVVSQNTSRRATMRVFANRDIQVYAEVAGSDWLSLSSLSYPVD